MASGNGDKIRKSLTEQLKNKGAFVPAFEDLIDDYVTFYLLKEKLSKDIKERGITVEEYRGNTPVEKENPSVRSLINVNLQMLTILDRMKINPDSVMVVEDENSDL